MAVPRGNVRKIVKIVGKIQSLIEEAESNHHNDRNKDSHVRTTECLKEAYNLCLDIRNMYDPID
ncbi:hypothetical protein QB910_000118 [Dabrowskivirus KKP3916]|uniref:Uncharacterized protein n=1 Tax=Alicyclobacillus phage KKP_3916 TaxID=3040651 RepID=A0AAT9V7Q2_9CAUD|nr:hypothetical protein QB910_000118 [Alicyclobacillus phage KKP 3916]